MNLLRQLLRQLVCIPLLILSYNNYVHGEESLRHCMVLPITDSVNGILGYRVFQEVEDYLKESSWCVYKSNSDLINIFLNYQSNLEAHLTNKDVLHTIAKKVQSGSLIKVNLKVMQKIGQVELKILGENGEDVYFSQKIDSSKDDVKIISQIIINWLEEYSKVIPYDGRVLGVLGKQITVDMGKKSDVEEGDIFYIKRPIKRKRHPLLKEIVEWETENLGQGKIIKISDYQAVGVLEDIKKRNSIKMEDWIVIDQKRRGQGAGEDFSSRADRESEEEKDQSMTYGKIGMLALHLSLGSGEVENNFNNKKRSFQGFMYGLDGSGEIWATRNFLGHLQLGRRTGTYQLQSGPAIQTSNDVETTTIKAFAGYKYLFMGYFYGPQLDAILGYSHYNYNVGTNSSDGLGSMSFSGPLFGVRGSLPFLKSFRLHLDIDFILNPSFTDDSALYGESKSTTNYSLNFGFIYFFNSKINFDTSLYLLSNEARFGQTKRNIHFQETCLKTGLLFIF